MRVEELSLNYPSFSFARLTLPSPPTNLLYVSIAVTTRFLKSGENVDLGVEFKLRTNFSNAHLSHSMTNLNALIDSLSLSERANESTGKSVSRSVSIDDRGRVESGNGVDFVNGGSGDDRGGRSLGDDDDSGSGRKLGGSGEL